jgi:hypothetical protein
MCIFVFFLLQQQQLQLQQQIHALLLKRRMIKIQDDTVKYDMISYRIRQG